MMVTLKDISLACGVSISTVSKALGDYPDIGEETRQRILTTAEKMGYITQRMESDAARRHTFTVGLLVTGEEETAFHGRVITEIRKILSRKGYDLVVLSPVNAGCKRQDQPGYMFRVRSMGLEGVFLFTQISERSLFRRGEMQNLRDLILGDIPVVGVDCSLAPCGCVIPDYSKGIRGLVDAVYGEGHRRIAFVYGDHAGARGIFEQDYIMAMREKNIQVPQSYLCCVRDNASGEAYARTLDLLRAEQGPHPTCILYSDDLLLEGGVKAIHDGGLQIPGDISVAALRFTGHRLPAGNKESVTSWWLSPSRIAEEAVSMMLSETGRAGLDPGRVCLVNGTISCDNCENEEHKAHGKTAKNRDTGGKENVCIREHVHALSTAALI